MAVAGLKGGEIIATPGEDEAENVAEVMACIGQEHEGTGPETGGGFDDHEEDIESDADGEGAGEVFWDVMIVVVSVHVSIVWLCDGVCQHWNRECGTKCCEYDLPMPAGRAKQGLKRNPVFFNFAHAKRTCEL